jgi:hypothetical protein
MAELVLLGAGASFGSEPNREIKTPPLGMNLFSELQSLAGFSSRIPEYIAAVFKRDFEEGMMFFSQEMPSEVQEFHRELSRYLSMFTPTSDSRFVRLLECLRKRNVIISSLNYDLMLEEAAKLVGLTVKYDIFRQHGSVRLIKPHGSANFWPDLPVENFRNFRTGYAGGILVSAPVKPLDRADSIARSVADDSFAPAMSMYAKGKHVSICPDFVSFQQTMFKQACRRASKITVVGVRVVPEDSHIWGPIAYSAADLFYFGNDNDRTELSSWVVDTARKNVKFKNGYFDSALSFIASSA